MTNQKTPIKAIAFMLLFSASLYQVEAQIFKKLKKKIEKKVETKLEEKINKESEKLIDTSLNGKDKKNKKNSTYTFNQSITLEISSKNNEKTELEFLFSNSNTNIVCMSLDASKNGGSSGEVYAVITSDKATLFMNMPGIKIKKSGNAQDFMQYDHSNKVLKKEELKKTGKTKTILGFLCHEYTYQNEGNTINAWVTNDNFPIKGKYIPILGMKKNGPYNGFVMELNFTSTNDNGMVRVSKINKNKNIVINEAEYKSM
jgi:hypothetical protein